MQAHSKQDDHPETGTNGPQVPEKSVPVHDAHALTEGGGRAHIMLGDQLYVLKVTRAGKLILTK